MTSFTLNVPESLELETAMKFCATLQQVPAHDEYILNFSKTKNTPPFGMLLAATELRQFKFQNPQSLVHCVNFQHMTYAMHMGFFKWFGADIGKSPGQASGGKNYIPLTYFRTDKLVRDAAMNGHDVGDEVESHSKRLTETLIGQNEGDVFEMFSYSIREIMRNVVEHANAEAISICSQYWPTKGRAEVAIIDRGIGLRSSLSKNPHIDVSDDRKALHFALMPAVSGKAFKGSRKQANRGPWTNSGFGLYMTSRLCRNGGNFFISSGKTGMLLTAGKGGKRVYDTELGGTAIRMTIRTSQISDLKDMLARYREEGYEIQKNYREIVSIDPSSASLMLSEDFNLPTWTRLLGRFKS